MYKFDIHSTATELGKEEKKKQELNGYTFTYINSYGSTRTMRRLKALSRVDGNAREMEKRKRERAAEKNLLQYNSKQ